jgi:acetylornithine deacetylase
MSEALEEKDRSEDLLRDAPSTTMSVTTAHGGTAANILAGQCVFTWDIRDVPSMPAERVRADVNRVVDRLLESHARFGVRIETEMQPAVPPLHDDPDSVAATSAAAVLRTRKAEYMSIGSEAGMFQKAGIPAVLCGPGSIAQAHGPDEHVEPSQLRQCEMFLDGMIGKICCE